MCKKIEQVIMAMEWCNNHDSYIITHDKLLIMPGVKMFEHIKHVGICSLSNGAPT